MVFAIFLKKKKKKKKKKKASDIKKKKKNGFLDLLPSKNVYFYVHITNVMSNFKISYILYSTDDQHVETGSSTNNTNHIKV